VRLSELLDWLGRQLTLTWVEQPPAAAPPPMPAAATLAYPAAPALDALQSAIDLGFVRGIANILEAIARDQPECRAFVEQMRGLSRQFQFEAMGRILHDARRAA
jgi:hypothetical protein